MAGGAELEQLAHELESRSPEAAGELLAESRGVGEVGDAARDGGSNQ
jgi:hypothetical protein